MNTAEQKAAQRETMRAKRNSIDLTERSAYENALQSRLFELPAFKNARHIAVYNPVGSEARFIRNLNHLYDIGGFVVGFPIVRTDEEMDFASFEVHDDRTILENPLRIVTAFDESRIIDPAQFDIVLVPGLAFDKHGNRLGQGKGYYDRFLPKLRGDCLVVGIAFDEQVIDDVAHDDTDARVGYIVTPTRVISAER